MNIASISTLVIALGALITAIAVGLKAPTDRRIAEVQAEDVKVKMEDSRAGSLMEYVNFVNSELRNCHTEIRGMREELTHKDGLIDSLRGDLAAARNLIQGLRGELAQAQAHIAELERRRDWRPPPTIPAD